MHPRALHQTKPEKSIGVDRTSRRVCPRSPCAPQGRRLEGDSRHSIHRTRESSAVDESLANELWQGPLFPSHRSRNRGVESGAFASWGIVDDGGTLVHRMGLPMARLPSSTIHHPLSPHSRLGFPPQIRMAIIGWSSLPSGLRRPTWIRGRAFDFGRAFPPWTRGLLPTFAPWIQ